MAEARRAEVSFFICNLFVSILGFLLIACSSYNMVLFLQELQKNEAARGAAGARSSPAMEAPALKAPSLTAEAPKPLEPMCASADPKV